MKKTLTLSNKPYFDPVDPKVNFPQLEEKILQFWKKEKIFEKSLEKDSPRGNWTFVDGPPFITGLPHYGSLLSSIPKDLFPRFKTMQGYRVRRVWGWDCHGLPAENKVEKKLGLKRKKDIEEKIGVKKFIGECKLYVKEVSSEWEWYVDHVGRWVDFKNAYKTMDNSYMESVMWVFKQMYEKGFIYKGLRVSLYCPHCSTPISNFEVAMDPDNYKDITEAANTYKYKVAGKEKTFFIAWSTTPWNKIATPSLAVNPKLDYVKVSQNGEFYILAKSTLPILKPDQYKILETFKGSKLVGMKFEPHFDFYKIDDGKKAFVVIPGDFVTADEGTGIVTIAAYGEDDLAAMEKNNIQVVMHLDDEGLIKPEVPKFGGINYLEANKAVNEDLVERGLMYKEEQYTHTVPTCWRCGTRLYYAPQNAWYVDIQKLKPLMKKTNEKVNWYPAHFKYGRFLKSMEAAPDWCISRSRYWGSPVPVWECECGTRFVPGSIAELVDASGKKISDLHKPEIDEVKIKCKNCGKQAKRVPEVLDSWIEAGSAPFAERHYPFEKGLDLSEFFPPDFIVEYTGQIRAWFYVLHAIATAIFESHAFKNVVVTGVILGTDGRKMSKNYGNYPDPRQMLQKYGGDALRLYLLGSPVMGGEDIRISEEDYRNQAKAMLVLWNIYNFFVTYANMDDWKPSKSEFAPEHILDKWIISRMWGSIKNFTEKALERYDSAEAVALMWIFIIRDLSGWYVRRIRDRVGPSASGVESKKSAYSTLWVVLTTYCKVIAPLTPFLTEEIYKNLTKNESVHLESWPKYEKSKPNAILEKEMETAINLASKVHAFRKLHNLKVRIPLRELHFDAPEKLSEDIMKIILDEVNVYKMTFVNKNAQYVISGDVTETNQDLKSARARDLIRAIQEERKNLGTSWNSFVNVTLPDWPKEYESEIKKKALVKSFEKGNFKVEIAS